MVKTMASTLPWAVVLVAAGVAIWWLLSQDMAAGRWLLAALLIGHGVVHLLFAVPGTSATDGGAAWPFDMSQSWAVTRAGLDLGLVRVVGAVLIAITVGAFALAALATVGIIVPSGWWQPTITLGAIASMATLVMFFDPQLVLGLGIDAVLLWVAATRASMSWAT
jgi:hypothetical protein